LLAVLLVAASVAACDRPAKDWRRQLRSEDPFQRLLAALALCEAHPRHSSATILVLFKAMESDVERDRLAAERALDLMAPYNTADLAQFLVVAGPDREIVRTKLAPILRDAGPEAAPLVLQALRDNDWIGPPEARGLLLANLRSDPGFAGALAGELTAPGCSDRDRLADLLVEAGPAVRPALRAVAAPAEGDGARAQREVLERLEAGG